jgi:PPOX class probable F420-dependent enzyme
MSPATSFTADEREFLESHRVARLATADAQGRPHAVPIVYAVLNEVVYFIVDEKPKKTRRGLKRLRNIAANPRAAVIIDDYDEDWSRLAYLLIQGAAAEVADTELYAAALAALRRRYPQYERMTLTPLDNPIIAITPAKVHFWRAREALVPR